MSADPVWLVRRPVAHRGLHDSDAGLIENTRSAAAAAIDADYAIECDVQISADGEAIVFHDFDLDRLTLGQGRVDAMPVSTLVTLAMRATQDRISTFADFLAFVGGRVPVLCEIKSRFDGDQRLSSRIAELASAYSGPLALMSFDPAVMAGLQQNRARFRLDHVPLGMVAKAAYDDPKTEWSHLPAREKSALAQCLHAEATRPEFLAYGL
ncbi:MAG TPA: glycerophosphodiester phosphodiesterase family protein, partial [Beijerinckiaceae bacterium]|nr:glycerophosphodiester phosphodiesterase family protein [Beijerinckiaceae bacterium]